jgi:hypothetical protein
MTPNLEEICVQRLTAGQSLKVRDAVGCTVMCCAGTVWITQENDARDIFLTAGQRFTFDRPGLALIHAEEGMRNEWMDDTGITVISLPAIFARDDGATS